jgi:predicted DNA-binding transcriptional regulator AlpA
MDMSSKSKRAGRSTQGESLSVKPQQRRTIDDALTTRHLSSSKTEAGFERLLTARETADRLRVSLSWLAKARMYGDGPPFVKLGRSIRYAEGALSQWTRLNLRLSTN